MTIKQKMLVSMIAAALICALAVFVTSIILFIGNINEAAENRLEISMGLVEREIEQMKSAAFRAALQVTDYAELADAIARGDREEVVRLSIRLKNLTGVETLAIADADAVIVARAHDPGNYGDSIANQFNIQSALAGTPIATIEIGTVVRFSVRGGAPIYDSSGALVGAVTVGFRLDTLDIVDALKELTRGEVTFYMNDENVATTIMQPSGERAIGVAADERISRMVLAGQPYMGTVSVLDRNVRVKYAPLRDAGGTVLGMLSVGEYTAGDTEKIWFFAVSAAVATLIVIILGIAGSIFVSGTISKQLTAATASLRQISASLDTAANTVSDSAASIAEASSEQAASVEETSATVNETASMTAQNAENAKLAEQITAKSSQTISGFGRLMMELMDTMAKLEESNSRVSKIAKTIDDIAFQTNLLAINATVEAARAGGDAGRSFGVVAEEVRGLAQRSAKEVTGTSELIEKNIALTQLSKSSAEKIMELTKMDAEDMLRLGRIMAEITAASEEQVNGAHQITMAVSQIEKSSQSNAATSQQSAASAAMLKELVADLDAAHQRIDLVVHGARA